MQALPRWLLPATACALALASGVPAQDQMRTWGVNLASDTEVFHVPAQHVSVAANRDLTVVVTVDGRLLAFGENYEDAALPPRAPTGLQFVKASASGLPMAELSDGRIVQWQDFHPPTPPPTLPPGMTWIDFCSTRHRSFALRSDGIIASWGETAYGLELVPTLGPGLFYESISAGGFHISALVSDGTIRMWGALQGGLLATPSLPAGIACSKVCSGHFHTVALRSDGQIATWGDNTFGQCNVPALPAGTSYVDVVAGGFHTIALRSDGQWLAWGRNDRGQCNIPSTPAGTFVRMFAGMWHTMAQRASGHLESWGRYETAAQLASGFTYREHDVARFGGGIVVDSDGSLEPLLSGMQGPAPALPAGTSYEACSAGYDFALGLGSDGQVRAWGENLQGQLNVPSLPPGVAYTDVDAGAQNAAALRSDGRAIAWGYNAFGQNSIPGLPTGMQYVDVAAGHLHVVLLRSDGSIVVTGAATGPLANPPSPPPGTYFTSIAAEHSLAAALCSDGTLVSWGSWSTTLPPLPTGLSYVEVACADNHAVARRSDGIVVTWGSPTYAATIPPLPPGRSYLRIAANWDASAGLIGSASRYVPIGSGCGGSLPPSRLVPRDTPQVGRRLPILVTNLPLDAALLVFGWNHLRPGVSFAPVGMPGCFAHVSLDAASLVTGSGNESLVDLEIPYNLSLRGTTFFTQAFVLDPGAGNAMSAVMSEAMTATIGG